MRRWIGLLVLVAAGVLVGVRWASSQVPGNSEVIESRLLDGAYPGLHIGDHVTLFLRSGSANSPSGVDGAITSFDQRQFVLSAEEDGPGQAGDQKRRVTTTYWIPRDSILCIYRGQPNSPKPSTQP